MDGRSGMAINVGERRGVTPQHLGTQHDSALTVSMVRSLRFVKDNLEQQHSSVSGLPQLMVRDSSASEALVERVTRDVERATALAAALRQANVRDLRELRSTAADAALLASRRASNMARARETWRLKTVGKWRTLCELHALRSNSLNRFAPALDGAYALAIPQFYASVGDIARVFLSNYAFETRETRNEALQLLQGAVRAVDERGSGVLDWRELVAHLRVLEAPKQKSADKLVSLFRLFQGPDSMIDLGALWSIARCVCLEYEKGAMAALLVQRLTRVVSLGLSTWHARGSGEDLRAFLDGIANAQRSASGQVGGGAAAAATGGDGTVDSFGPVLPELGEREEDAGRGRGGSSGSGQQALKQAQAKVVQGLRQHQEYTALSREQRSAARIRLGLAQFVRVMGEPCQEELAQQRQEQQRRLSGSPERDHDDLHQHQQQQSPTSSPLSSPSGGTLALVGVAGNDCLQLWSKLCWDRQPDGVKLRIVHAQEESAAQRFAEFDAKIKWVQAVAWFTDLVRPRILWKRFLRWRQVAVERAAVRRGRVFFEFKCKRLALERIAFNAERHILGRWRARLADKLARRGRLRLRFCRWKQLHTVEHRTTLIQVQKAKAMFRSLALERWFREWRRNARQLRGVATMIKRREARAKRLYLAVWSVRVRKALEHRRGEDAAAGERQKLIEHELREAERVLEAQRRAREEQEAREREAAEAARLEAEAQAARWELERMRAHEAFERGKKLRKQEQVRVAHKTMVVVSEDGAFEETYAFLLREAVASAEHNAKQFLKSPQGREQMRVEAESIRNDVDRMQLTRDAGAANQEGSDWKKMFDPDLESYFFFNRETGEKVPALALSVEDSTKIAEGNYLATMVAAAKADVEAMRSEELRKKQLLRVARMVQGAWRTRKSRKLRKHLLCLCVFKRADPYTGKQYYYNVQTRTRNMTKPLMLGPREDLKLHEWGMRCDADGVWTYENRVSPWLTSTTKPAGFTPCLACKVQLSFITCLTCQVYYCLDCFERAHPLKSVELKTHETRRKPYEDMVKEKPEQCAVCKSDIASTLCLDCGLDYFYCGKCFAMSHMRDPRKPTVIKAKMTHTKIVDL